MIVSHVPRLDHQSIRLLLREFLVEGVRNALPRIREQLGEAFLPVPPSWIRLEDLDLDARTFNCLAKLDVQEDLQLMGNLRIRDLLAIKGFGARCLVDLLVALDVVNRTMASEMAGGGSTRRAHTVEDAVNSTNGSNQRSLDLRASDIEIICEHIQREGHVPHEMRERCLPKLPDELNIDPLELKTRTYNCLEKAGFIPRPSKLSGRTLRSILKLPNFGKDSLMDLLIWLQPFIGRTEREPIADPDEAQALATEAKQLEQMPGSELISGDDPRLGKLVRSIVPNAENAMDAAEQLLRGSYRRSAPRAVTNQIRSFREEVSALSRMKLEAELLSIFPTHRERDLAIFVRRFGLDGRLPMTLEQLGRQYGLTRERVRQLCERLNRMIEDKHPFAPALDLALAHVTASLPGIAADIEANLVTKHIAVTPFRLESLKKAAVLLGREVAYSIEAGKHRAVVANGLAGSSGKVLQIARRTVEHWGAVTFDDVVNRVNEKFPIPDELVRRIVIGQSDFRWLDERSGWFWLMAVPRNRLTNQIQKVFSVTHSISVGELRAGVRRHHRMQGFAPPERVLLEFCRQIPWCSVEDNTVRLKAKQLPPKILSKTEETMATILKRHGSVMQREIFEEECVANGMNRTTFYMYIEYSPVITKYARGVYGLRGADVPPGLVESLRPKIQRGRVLKDYGWQSDGKLWVGYKLSESTVATGVCSIPASLTRFIEGEFQFLEPNGRVAGNLGINKTSAWGLRPFFSRRGVDAGDHLVLLFDLSLRTATAHIGDQNTLESFQG
jgi:Bacterial RNA polymerase, alpha chain C terminal domain/Sigma-70, region 4